MAFTLIQNGEVYTPIPSGIQSILVDDEKILKVGQLDTQKVLDLGIPCNIVNADGYLVVPGLVDPHSHILGAGGEHGFTSRMPELGLDQIVCAGITTVVGLLGTDTTTRDLTALYAKASQLFTEGITAYMYTGGFEIPASSITGSIKDDQIIIDKVIGTGEIAISDYRWVDPKLHELAVVVAETMLGGMQAGKAGITHFHTGEGKKRLSLLRELLDQYEIPPACLYITHIERSEALMDDAVAMAKRGCYVDMDTAEDGIPDAMSYYLKKGGPANQLTISSDSNTPGAGPQKLSGQMVACVKDAGMRLEDVLPHFTSNTARVLKLGTKGKLEERMDADILILKKGSLEIKDVFARGQQFVKDGQLIKESQEEQQAEESAKQ